MKIEIDQSGKIENTNRKTVIAFSNSKNGVLVILPKDKKAIQKYFRTIGKPKLFIHITFVTLIYFLIKSHIKTNDQIVIDREYPGYEKLIIRLFKDLIKNNTSVKGISVSIAQIGKKSPAHDLAWKELQKRVHKSNMKIDYGKVIRAIKKSGSI
jgi:hypothetical protein